MRLLLLPIACMCLTTPARADWQFTHWGMTPDQVVAASNGSAKLLPVGERRSNPPLDTIAEGTFEDGPVSLHTAFMFDTTSGGLACVIYGPPSQRGNGALKEILLKRFGSPQTEDGMPAIGMESLGWKSGKDEVDANFMAKSAAFVMQCAGKG